MLLSFLTASCQDRGSIYCCLWNVAIVSQYTKTGCPDGPCVSPSTAHKLHHWGFSCYCHPRCNPGFLADYAGVGEVNETCTRAFEKMCEIGVWVLSVLAQSGVYCAGGWAPYWHPWSLPLTSKLCSALCFSFTKYFPSSHSLQPVRALLPPPPPISLLVVWLVFSNRLNCKTIKNYFLISLLHQNSRPWWGHANDSTSNSSMK